tara:strand:- start:17753 stop:18190 length:438 start_codon:yes stop_codon:yes gene_type:complete
MVKKKVEQRSNFNFFLTIPTRWMDNDVYGHVNNVIYYSYFDTAINTYLINEGGLRINSDQIIGVCAESGCQYNSPISFPEVVDAGLSVDLISNKSVKYEIALFTNKSNSAAAQGWFFHVFVNRINMTPTNIPSTIKTSLEKLVKI